MPPVNLSLLAPAKPAAGAAARRRGRRPAPARRAQEGDARQAAGRAARCGRVPPRLCAVTAVPQVCNIRVSGALVFHLPRWATAGQPCALVGAQCSKGLLSGTTALRHRFFLQRNPRASARAWRQSQPGARATLAGSGDKAAPAAGGGAGEAALRKEVAALRKHEAKLAARVAALEAEAGAGAGARSELEAAKAGLEAQLKARAAAAPRRCPGAEGLAQARGRWVWGLRGRPPRPASEAGLRAQLAARACARALPGCQGRRRLPHWSPQRTASSHTAQRSHLQCACCSALAAADSLYAGSKVDV
jgi:hypothetical protein